MQDAMQRAVFEHLPILDRDQRSDYDAFKEDYRDDPLGFVLECIEWREGQELAPYQREILEELPKKKRVCVRGPHGLGKTSVAALVVLWFALTRDGEEDWKVPTTAGAWRQLTRFLWPEIRKWARRISWRKVGRPPFTQHELLMLNLKLETGEAFALASDDHALIEGAHADQLLYVFDESKSIPPETFDAAEGAFAGAGEDTGGEAYALSFSTPGEPTGRFYEIQARKPGYEDWWVRHVSLAECIRAGRISGKWAEQRARQWGAESAVYINRVLGQFAASDEDAVIPLSWVEAAIERFYERIDAEELGSLETIGVDVAYGGEDDTALAPRFGNTIREIKRHPLIRDTSVVAGLVSGILKAHNPDARAVIDVIGYGAGTYHDLKNEGYNVQPFVASEKTSARDASGELGFTNKRSHAWWNLRELLDPNEGDDIALPPDDGLVGDLIAPTWHLMAGGKIQVEKKEDIRKRIGRSTDAGDAAVMAFYPEPPPRPKFRVKRVGRLGRL